MVLQKLPKLSLFSLTIILLAVAACAGQAVHHSFSFSASKDTEILNYKYGDSKLAATYAPDWELKTGHIEQGNGITGIFPPGDFLYVKWRVISTGKIYEDNVDLKSRLPSDMADKRVTFITKGAKLFVYLIYPEKYAKNAPCPAYDQHSACIEIYPEHWQNF